MHNVQLQSDSAAVTGTSSAADDYYLDDEAKQLWQSARLVSAQRSTASADHAA
jgi:hypothetical protein